jgi:hypothetical protein
MRAALAVAAAVLVGAAPALVHANPLPPGSLQAVGGAIAGTGVDASRVGWGYQLGAQASWQPMASEQRLGWAFRWTTLFGHNYEASAARIDDVLRTVLLDATVGLRLRPWTTPRRYLTLRGGVGFLRSNEEIAPANVRDYVGPVASVGIDQYAYSWGMLSVDVRYGLIAEGPSMIALVVGVGVVGP